MKEAKRYLKTTPYNFLGKAREYSSSRTSKVMYLNEKLNMDAMKVSKSIEIATDFRLSNEKFASENFQIMNYGIGGRIAPHLDSSKITIISQSLLPYICLWLKK